MLSIFCFIVLLSGFGDARIILPTFSWDPRNEMFKGSMCGGSESYAHIAVPLDSEMYFVCPSVVMLSKLQIGYVSKTNMYENMYMVTKDEFDRCEIDHVDGENTRKVMMCNSPKDPNMLKFNRFFFTSLTTQIAFLSNTTYYFIATSNGQESSLNNLRGGRCKSDNMKIAITICDGHQKCEQNQNLCAVPKQPTTTPATTTTVRTTTTTKVQRPVVVNTPQAAPQSTNSEGNSKEPKRFGVVAVVCLIAGLVVGVAIGVIAVFVVQKYAKRYNEKKTQNGDDVFNTNKNKGNIVNAGYRDSKEIKRLLSTSSNASSERYSHIPVTITAPKLVPAPAGSIPV